MKTATKWIVGIAGAIVYTPLILCGDEGADKLLDLLLNSIPQELAFMLAVIAGGALAFGAIACAVMVYRTDIKPFFQKAL